MCSALSSAAWVARKYEIPVLTLVLNNGGWKAPRDSTALVYPDGLNKTATDDELNISFNPSPNYAALVEAAAGSGSAKVAGGWMKGARVTTVKELRKKLEEAAERVQVEGRGMLVEALMENRECAVSASPQTLDTVTNTKTFRLVVEQDDVYDVAGPYFLAPNASITSKIALAGIYTLNLTSGELLVGGAPVSGIEGQNYTTFKPQEAPLQYTEVFYLRPAGGNPNISILHWVNANWRLSSDNEALFATGYFGGDTTVYAYFNGSVPDGYFPANLTTRALNQE